MSANYTPGNIATYNPTNIADYNAGSAVYNSPIPAGVNWVSTVYYEFNLVNGEPLGSGTFNDSGSSPSCPAPTSFYGPPPGTPEVIEYNVTNYECTPTGSPTPGNLSGYEGNTANYNPGGNAATYNAPTISGYNAPPTPGTANYTPGNIATYNPTNAASYNPTNVASYNAGNAVFTPGNLIPGGGNTQNYNTGNPATYNPPNITSYFGNTAVPGNSNISGYTGNNVATYSGVSANYNIGAAASYNPPSIVGYNSPIGMSNPNYNVGNPATYTSNFVSGYNTGSAGSYNTGVAGAYNPGVAASYNTGVAGGYNEGIVSGYTGNNATFAPGNVVNYVGNNVATFNAAGNQTFTPGNPSGFTGNNIASYNAGTQNYNAPTITSYNPTNAATYNAPTITGYNAPSGGGGGCCFSGDTLITMADHSTKPINAIEIGDQILSYNFDTEELETNEVAEIITRVNRVMFEYILENGITLKASDDHPLFVVGKGFSSMNPELTKQGYKSLPDVGMIAAGDSLVNKNGDTIRINKIVPIDYPHIVYTLNNRYKSSPTFYANGVLTY